MDKKWRQEENEVGDCFVMSPTDHEFYFGNMEGTSKCCFDEANYVVTACNFHQKFLDVLEKIYNDPLTSTYFTYQIGTVLKEYKKERNILEKKNE